MPFIFQTKSTHYCDEPYLNYESYKTYENLTSMIRWSVLKKIRRKDRYMKDGFVPRTYIREKIVDS